MKHTEQELWQLVRRISHRAQRRLDAVRRDYKRIEEIRRKIHKQRLSDEDIEF